MQIVTQTTTAVTTALLSAIMTRQVSAIFLLIFSGYQHSLLGTGLVLKEYYQSLFLACVLRHFCKAVLGYVEWESNW